MKSYIRLGKILQRFKDQGFAQAPGLYVFKYHSENHSSVSILRENGNIVKVLFPKIIVAIEALQEDPSLYNAGPSALREFGITHITSPVYALLHLFPLEDYK